MNKAESAALEQQLHIGMNLYAETADLVVINTCSVRITAETRIYGRLGWYSALKKERNGEKITTHHKTNRSCKVPVKKLTVVVTGCMAERLKDSLQKDFPVVDYVVGTFKKQHFQDIIDALEQNREIINLEENLAYSFAPLSYEQGEFNHSFRLCMLNNLFILYCTICLAEKFSFG